MGLVQLSREISLSRQLLRKMPGPISQIFGFGLYGKIKQEEKSKLILTQTKRICKQKTKDIKSRFSHIYSHEVWISLCIVLSFLEKSSTTSSVSKRAAKDPSTIFEKGNTGGEIGFYKSPWECWGSLAQCLPGEDWCRMTHSSP